MKHHALFSALPVALMVTAACSASPSGGGTTTAIVHTVTPAEDSKIVAVCKLALAGGCADDGTVAGCESAYRAGYSVCPTQMNAVADCALPQSTNICASTKPGGACKGVADAATACIAASKKTTSPTQPSTANSELCPNSGNQCSNYFCRCADGAPVNSSSCVNGSCQVAATHCESACQKFGHGKWTGTAGGGPGTTPPKPVDPSPSTDPIQALCDRETTGGCGDSGCVTQLQSAKAECPSETNAAVACARSAPACTSASNCSAQLATLKQCLGL